MSVTAKRARNLLTPLRSMFEDALNDELIDFNPFDRIALNKLLKQTTKASEYEVDPSARPSARRCSSMPAPTSGPCCSSGWPPACGRAS